MKAWLGLLLIAFTLIAGYKFSGYQHQLSESNAEKERLTTVLERSRATEASELKVIKPAAKLAKTESKAPRLVDVDDTELASAQFAQSTHSILPDSFYKKAEGSLNNFFALSPNKERFMLESVKCGNGLCEITGEYDGSETELSSVIAALEKEPWWQFGSPTITTKEIQRGLRLNVSFVASYLPSSKVQNGTSARVQNTNGAQPDSNNQQTGADHIASAG